MLGAKTKWVPFETQPVLNNVYYIDRWNVVIGFILCERVDISDLLSVNNIFDPVLFTGT